MSKKLKIQFWKSEKALAMQILEQEGLPERKEDGLVKIYEYPFLFKEVIELRGYKSSLDWKISGKEFDTNTERDSYLNKIINAITDELFTNKGELKVGELCEVSNCNNVWHTYKLLAILPTRCDERFIVELSCGGWTGCDRVRPIAKRIEPKVEECGNVVTYTWEEK